MSDLHSESASERADTAEMDARFLVHLIDQLTVKVHAIIGFYDGTDGSLDFPAADDAIDQLRKLAKDARAYANLED
jgi:hypothetical protein